MADITVPIKYLDNSPVIPAAPTPGYQYSQGGGYLRPFHRIENLVGTGSGNVSIRIQTRPSADDTPVFVSLAQMQLFTNAVGTGLYCFFEVETAADWSYGREGTRQPVDVTEQRIVNSFADPLHPLVLGQLAAGKTGEIKGFFETDVIAKTYTAALFGWISDRPFLTPLGMFPG